MQLTKIILLAIASCIVTATPLPEADNAVAEAHVSCATNTTTGLESCQLIRPDSLNGLQKREIVGKVYWSNDGYVKFILPWIVNNQIAQAFLNSGFNLGKDLMSEMLNWILANSNYATQVTAGLSDWSGQIDQKARYLNDLVGTTANYATIAVVAFTGNAENAYEIANAMARWYGQSGAGSDVVSLGSTSAEFYGDAPNSKARRSEEELDEASSVLEQRATDWCKQPIGGLYNAGSTQHTPRGLYYDFSC